MFVLDETKLRWSRLDPLSTKGTYWRMGVTNCQTNEIKNKMKTISQINSMRLWILLTHLLSSTICSTYKEHRGKYQEKISHTLDWETNEKNK